VAAADLFRVLGDPERLRLLVLLADGVGGSVSVVSQRLRVLRLEGLLTRGARAATSTTGWPTATSPTSSPTRSPTRATTTTRSCDDRA